jgi:hypothetical protein
LHSQRVLTTTASYILSKGVFHQLQIIARNNVLVNAGGSCDVKLH